MNGVYEVKEIGNEDLMPTDVPKIIQNSDSISAIAFLILCIIPAIFICVWVTRCRKKQSASLDG